MKCTSTLSLFLTLLPTISVSLQVSHASLSIDRRRMLSTTGVILLTSPITVAPPVYAFEGGIGGLGKTKPDTGVVFLEGSAPIQNKQGIVTAELLSGKGNPILVEFTAPYPLLPTTNGLEARDLQQSESAFVQVIYGVKPQVSEKELYSILIDQVFGSKGKYGAYGSPSDIKISPALSSNDVKQHFYKVTFTTLTPGMRESERKLLLRCAWCDEDTLVMLLVGTTRLRFKAKVVEDTLTGIANSFFAVEAPRTELLRRSQSK